MPRKKASKNVKLDDLEKPLSEQEMKETTGGFGQSIPKPKIIPPGAPPQVQFEAPPSFGTAQTSTPPTDVIVKDGNVILNPNAGQYNGTQPSVYVNPNVKITPPPPFNAGPKP
ncbi:hypothetical protein FE783_29085 [Paenibacillus mesophilus]|uniref:hypothetical protein n=1 Tax=Paenibacillus mesophilus TaxID=2582849 RepID=UPI00110D5854|nr:hypothetical protein [Paenibacillus mesophilus]TMV45556.1 hypothetical protein FE783_29085 [Paenibacillus mesophilus]